jgi:hypothetical protein
MKSLIAKELVGRAEEGEYRIVEPFFAEWLQREQHDRGVSRELRQAPPG